MTKTYERRKEKGETIAAWGRMDDARNILHPAVESGKFTSERKEQADVLRRRKHIRKCRMSSLFPRIRVPVASAFAHITTHTDSHTRSDVSPNISPDLGTLCGKVVTLPVVGPAHGQRPLSQRKNISFKASCCARANQSSPS